jgi:hypothetical protein
MGELLSPPPPEREETLPESVLRQIPGVTYGTPKYFALFNLTILLNAQRLDDERNDNSHSQAKAANGRFKIFLDNSENRKIHEKALADIENIYDSLVDQFGGTTEARNSIHDVFYGILQKAPIK